MSVGTLADRASRLHMRNINRQKKVVFGERPTEISTLTLKLNEELNGSKRGTVGNQFDPDNTMASSHKDNMQSQNTQLTSQTTQNLQEGSTNKNVKGTGKPWYIISADHNKYLNLFKIFMGLIAVPSVLFNLFL